MNSKFIKCQSPGGSVLPRADTIGRILSSGWVAQKKMDGARTQVHISSSGIIDVYTRHGSLHTKDMPDNIKQLLRQHFSSKIGWNVLDCEWLRHQDKLYIFDIMKWGDVSFHTLTYEERYKILSSHAIITPEVSILPLYTSIDKCLAVLQEAMDDKFLEGLVFKAYTSTGWSDTGMVRCRKKGFRFGV